MHIFRSGRMLGKSLITIGSYMMRQLHIQLEQTIADTNLEFMHLGCSVSSLSIQMKMITINLNP